jgi:hypothetical protein
VDGALVGACSLWPYKAILLFIWSHILRDDAASKQARFPIFQNEKGISFIIRVNYIPYPSFLLVQLLCVIRTCMAYLLALLLFADCSWLESF